MEVCPRPIRVDDGVHLAAASGHLGQIVAVAGSAVKRLLPKSVTAQVGGAAACGSLVLEATSAYHRLSRGGPDG